MAVVGDSDDSQGVPAPGSDDVRSLKRIDGDIDARAVAVAELFSQS